MVDQRAPVANQSDDIMLLAGEASGDLYGAQLIQALQKRNANLSFCGMGSVRMQAAGLRMLFDCQSIAVVGLWEVLRNWPAIRRALRIIKRHIKAHPPKLLVLIDYVEFNLNVAAFAQKMQVPVLFYIGPQIWAWRPERVERIVRCVDAMAVIFPFEVDCYRAHQLPVRYVGHPLCGQVKPCYTRDAFLQKLGVDSNCRLVGLMPGSRHAEIRHILPAMLDAATLLNHADKKLYFLLPLAHTQLREPIQQMLKAHALSNVLLVDGQAYDVMAHVDSLMVTSGTATLEATLIGVPMVIAYRVDALTAWWIRSKLLIEHVGLVNIIRNKRVVPELLQGDCNGPALANEVLRQLNDADYRTQMLAEQALVRQQLGSLDATQETADFVLQLLRGDL